MEQIEFNLDDTGNGRFFILRGADIVGELEINISGDKLTAVGTEVSPESKGKGFGKKLISEMADYAREKSLKVVPKCPYVHAQFEKYQNEYGDVWFKG